MLKLIGTLALASLSASAQLPAPATWAVESQNHYTIRPNVVYGVWSGYETKLDVYQRRDVSTPQPTVIFFHGGGWIQGTKEASVMSIVPWLEMGWNVINVEYRMSHVALAPAAVEDCLCSLRWVAMHAKDYNVDLARIVVTGESAGGHLALTTGMIPMSAGLDRQCPGGGFSSRGPDLPKVASIISWYGITDLNAMVEGPDARSYVIEWLGSQPNREELARRVSPVTYVRRDLPPILMIHGDADPVVPYTQATHLRDALAKAGALNQLLTIPGAGHGNFKPAERIKIYTTIRDFLTKNHLM